MTIIQTHCPSCGQRLPSPLRDLRSYLTLDEVAAETGISVSHLSRLENGHTRPSPRVATILARFYERDVHEVMGWFYQRAADKAAS